ncbi:MAG: hypothetical protein KQI62_08065 [Deltaproteobacteria bacterium]|nr:hypothetical protein [Deltaproteobacteria bacterium]
MRKLLISAIVLAATFCTALAAIASGPAAPVLTVSGLVKQPLRLSMADLGRLPSVRVELNDIKSDGSFHGCFRLQGVPLREVLSLAQVGKEGRGFDRFTDLAVVVKNAQGQQVTLSWGEIFRHNPGQAVLALTAQPVRPYKGPEAWSDPAAYRKLMAQIERKVGFPKLVLARDSASDRSLEKVISLRVVEPVHTPQPAAKPAKLYAPSLSVIGPNGKEHKLEKLPSLPRHSVLANMVGPGRNYHGRGRFSGVTLADLLTHLKFKGDNQSAVVISAPDGYTSLISWGELFLSPQGRRIILADRMDGKPMDKQGRFALVVPDDFLSDRWVLAPAKLQMVRLTPQARLTVIGMGCGDSNLLTLEAIDALAQADVLVAPKDIQKRFAPYLLNKPVILDPMAAAGKKPAKKQMQAHKDSTGRHMYENQIAQAGKIITDQLAQGKNVAVLDWGDPMVYGSWRWIKDVLPPMEQIRFVSGLSAFNAGSAALGRDIACNGAIAITDPFTMFKRPEMLGSLAAKGATVVVFMAMPRFPKVIEALEAAYPPDTPAVVVYRAGMQNQKVVKSRLDQVLNQNKDREHWLGVVYVGPCLR